VDKNDKALDIVPNKDGWEDSLTRRKRQANGHGGFYRMSLIWLSLLNKSIGQRLELTPEAIELKPGNWNQLYILRCC